MHGSWMDDMPIIISEKCEEEKVIELAKQYVKDNKIDYGMSIPVLDNLIELAKNQQKEIEEYHKLKQDLVKVNKKIYDIETIENMCNELSNSIPKTKIKEKINTLSNIVLLLKMEGPGTLKILQLEEQIKVLRELIGENRGE